MTQITFKDLENAFQLNSYVITEVVALKNKINKLEDIKIITDDKNLSEFYLWKADVFQHINNIIFDFSKNKYRL